MKKLSLILSLVLLINCFSLVASYAATITGPYTGGDTTPTVRGLTVETINGLGGKATTDNFYKLSGSAATYSKNNVTVGGESQSNAAVYECSFMLPDDNSKLKMYISYNVGGTSTKQSDISISSAGFSWNTSHYNSDITDEPIENGKWYSLALELPHGATSKNAKANVYLNGEEIGTLTFKAFAFNYLDEIRLGCGVANAPIYIDNSHCYSPESDESFNPATSAKSVAGIADTSGKYRISGNTITAPAGASVQDVTNAITTTDAEAGTDVVRVYTNANMTELAENSTVADGTTLVVAAKNGTANEMTYSYYNIVEKGSGKYQDLIVNDGTSYSNLPGNCGKIATDMVYGIATTNGNGIHLPETFISDNRFRTKDWGYLEFSFAIPSDGAKLRAYCRFYNSDGDTNSTYIDFEAGKKMIEANKWYTACITVPTADDVGDGKIKAYVNGNLYDEHTPQNGAQGFDNPYLFTSGSLVYVDNIMMQKGNSYTPADDIPAFLDITDGIASNGRLSYIRALEATDFNLDANTCIRFYDNEWNVTDEISDSEYLVAVTKDSNGSERVYSYYNVDKAESDYIMGAKYDGTNITIKSFGKDSNATVYLGKYSDSTLVELVSKPVGGEVSASKDDRYEYRVFLWDDNLVPYAKITSFDYRK